MTKDTSFAFVLMRLLVVTSLTTTEANQATATGAITNQGIFFDPIALSFEQEVKVEQFGEPTRPTSSIRTNNSGKKNTLRHLDEDDGLLTKYSFPECIDESLTPEECKNLIETQIEDAGGHQVGDIQIKIQVPRTPEQFAESYWMVEVPVNAHGQVACDRNGGTVVYPFEWMDGTTGLTVADENCYGLTAGECCLKLRAQSKLLTSSGYDVNGQCLSCFVYQEPLEPIWNEDTGKTDYLECNDVTPGTPEGACRFEQLSGDGVESLDLDTANRIKSAIERLERFIEQRSCDFFESFLEKLYNAAVVIKPLSIKIGRLACSICYGEQDLSLEDDDVTALLMEILNLLEENSPPPSSKENCIIIYTDQQGDIALEPTLGGSRSENGPKQAIVKSCEVDEDCASENEWCDLGINKCRTFLNIGDSCGTNYYSSNLSSYGRCHPSEALCKDIHTCIYIVSPFVVETNTCVPYGQLCTSSDDCDKYEYCDDYENRCTPNRSEGQCCDATINDCGSDEAATKTLVCAPSTDDEFFQYYGYEWWKHRCQRRCDTDDDCNIGEGEQCVVIEEEESASKGESYCTKYINLGIDVDQK